MYIPHNTQRSHAPWSELQRSLFFSKAWREQAPKKGGLFGNISSGQFRTRVAQRLHPPHTHLPMWTIPAGGVALSFCVIPWYVSSRISGDPVRIVEDVYEACLAFVLAVVKRTGIFENSSTCYIYSKVCHPSVYYPGTRRVYRGGYRVRVRPKTCQVFRARYPGTR